MHETSWNSYGLFSICGQCNGLSYIIIRALPRTKRFWTQCQIVVAATVRRGTCARMLLILYWRDHLGLPKCSTIGRRRMLEKRDSEFSIWLKQLMTLLPKYDIYVCLLFVIPWTAASWWGFQILRRNPTCCTTILSVPRRWMENLPSQVPGVQREKTRSPSAAWLLPFLGQQCVIRLNTVLTYLEYIWMNTSMQLMKELAKTIQYIQYFDGEWAGRFGRDQVKTIQNVCKRVMGHCKLVRSPRAAYKRSGRSQSRSRTPLRLKTSRLWSQCTREAGIICSRGCKVTQVVSRYSTASSI